MKINIRTLALLAIAGLWIATLSFIGWEVYKTQGENSTLAQKIHKLAQQKINVAAQKISLKLQGYANIVRDAASKLEDQNLNEKSLNDILKEIMEKNRDIRSACAAYEPFMFKKNTKLFSSVYLQEHGSISTKTLPYDYTQPSSQAGAHTEWYHNAIAKGYAWSEPYFGTGAEEHIITYSMSIASPSNKQNPKGVIQIDITLEYLRDVVNSLALSKSSYGFLISPQGTFVAHPTKNYLQKELTIHDIDQNIDQTFLSKNIEQIVKQKSGHISYVNEVTKKQSLFYYYTIPGINLIFGIVFNKDELATTLQETNKTALHKGILVSLLLLLLFILFFFRKPSVKIIVILSTLFVFGIIFTGKEIHKSLAIDHSLQNKMDLYAHEQINEVTQKLEKRLQEHAQIVREAARELSKKAWTKEELDIFLNEKIKNHNQLEEFVIAFKPYSFDPHIKLYAPYYKRIQDGFTRDVKKFDYTLTTADAADATEWYRNFIESGEGWTDPYQLKQDQKDLISYSACFYDHANPKKTIGIVQAGLSLNYIRDLVNSLALGKRSYGFIITTIMEKFVAHPNSELYRKGLSLFDLAQKQKDKNLEEICYQMQQQPTGKAEYLSTISNAPSVLFYKAIPGTNLIMGIMFVKSEFFSQQALLVKHTKINIIFGIVLSLLLLILLLIHCFAQRIIHLIISTIICSFILLGGIGYLWAIQRMHMPTDEQGIIPIFDKNTIDKTVEECTNTTKNIYPPTLIKTGILLEKIEHVSNIKVYVSGKMWQKYPLSCPKSIIRDFLLPQAKIFFQKNLIFHEPNDKEEILVWRISGDLNQENLLSRAFPFDNQDIEIIMEHPSLNQNVLLVPDIDSYTFINPQARPGVVPSLQILDWFLEKTFFSFTAAQKDVELGSSKKGAVGQQNILTFTIQAKRDLFSLLIVYLLPLFVALLLLFFNLCMVNRERIMTNISLTSGIFLGLIVAHTAMRQIFIGSEILYLEYFYIVPYLLIILLLIDLILYAKKDQIVLIRHHDNLFIKLLFWPAFLLIMFVITGAMFW